MTIEKATKRDRKKTTAKKTGRKATRKATAKATDRKATEKATATARPSAAEQAERSGLVDVPDPQTGKALRRLMRKAGIWLSKDPSIGKVPVVIEDGMAVIRISGHDDIRTAVRSVKTDDA